MYAQVANAYGAGLTDWDQSSLYGKLCIFAFAAWGGHNDGVIAGLAVCGIMLSVTSAACGELGLQSACMRCHCCRLPDMWMSTSLAAKLGQMFDVCFQ